MFARRERCGVGARLVGGCRVLGIGAQAQVPRPVGGTMREGAPICLAGLCRFRPGVKCRISHVLSEAVRRVGDDFEVHCGYRLPETFEDRHGGTSFRAANWRGKTAGRGRQGHAATETPNAVYELAGRIPEPRAPLKVGVG